MTNRDRVGKALELLREGLAPYVEREVQEAVRAGAVNMETVRRFAEDPLLKNKLIADWDAASLLKLMWESWNDVFRTTLGFAERSLVSELREWRNRWAHQVTFSSDDTDRALDSAERLHELFRDYGPCLVLIDERVAYADSYDHASKRYRGLRCGENISLSDSDPQGLLVKPEAAQRQIEAEQPTYPTTKGAAPSATAGGTALAGEEPTSPRPPGALDTTAALPKRFHGSVALSPLRLGSEAGRIAEEVLVHFSSLPGAQVSVTLEIHVTVPDGVPDQVVRVVTENCRTLKFTGHGFERD
ncbi:MAG: hypothetical protein AA908_07065 [Chlorobi bacterium NICIL-2]|nr:MAG: hypothetical protein AA908_07065 [Chlorobi bacterium NICIL-2]